MCLISFTFIQYTYILVKFANLHFLDNLHIIQSLQQTFLNAVFKKMNLCHWAN